jgi:hypothetical protein
VSEALPDTAEEQAAKEGAEAVPEAPADDLELEIEVDGQREIVRGKDAIKELAQKGKYFSKGTEEIARVREALVANLQAQADTQAFQQAIVGDLADLKALDARLAEFNKIDWATAIDSDLVGVMKLQEQRAALRDARQQKLNEIQQKQQYHQQSQAQAASQMFAAEQAALVAKLPEWRNSEKAQAEKTAITQELSGYYGFQPSELAGLMDHRMVLVARDAMKWRALQRDKGDRLKQVRAAPPVSKPGSATAQTDEHGKAGFQKFTQELRRQGQKGNHRAQEALMLKALNRTFK